MRVYGLVFWFWHPPLSHSFTLRRHSGAEARTALATRGPGRPLGATAARSPASAAPTPAAMPPSAAPTPAVMPKTPFLQRRELGGKAVMANNIVRMSFAVVATVCLFGYCGAFAPPMAPPSAAPASRANPLALRMVAAPQGDERMGRRAIATFSAVAVAATFPLSGASAPLRCMCACVRAHACAHDRRRIRSRQAASRTDWGLHVVSS